MSRLVLCFCCFLVGSQYAEAGGCYRPFVGYSGHGYGHHVPHVAPSYFYYVPKIIEVEVVRDRYYALSDLYRDKMFLQMYDQWQARQAQQGYAPQQQEQPQQSRTSPVPPPPPPPPTAEQPRTAVPPLAAVKTGGKAAKVLANNCLSCHGKGDKRIDLSDPDAVSLTLRRAAFGLMATGDMPQPPANLMVPGKDNELLAWKKENAIKEEDLKVVYDEWVMPLALAQNKRK